MILDGKDDVTISWDTEKEELGFWKENILNHERRAWVMGCLIDFTSVNVWDLLSTVLEELRKVENICKVRNHFRHESPMKHTKPRTEQDR